MGCLLYAWWFGYSPFECEFLGNAIRVTECSASRVLSKIPKKMSMSEDDIKIYDIVEWILVKEIFQRPFLIDVINHIDEVLKNSQTGRVKDQKTLDNFV
jgi:hypothetical protein